MAGRGLKPQVQSPKGVDDRESVHVLALWRVRLQSRGVPADDLTDAEVLREANGDLRAMVQCLALCRFLPRSWDERFVRDMAALPTPSVPTVRQAVAIEILWHKYRGQLRGRWVPLRRMVAAAPPVPKVRWRKPMTGPDLFHFRTRLAALGFPGADDLPDALVPAVAAAWEDRARLEWIVAEGAVRIARDFTHEGGGWVAFSGSQHRPTRSSDLRAAIDAARDSSASERADQEAALRRLLRSHNQLAKRALEPLE